MDKSTFKLSVLAAVVPLLLTACGLDEGQGSASPSDAGSEPIVFGTELLMDEGGYRPSTRAAGQIGDIAALRSSDGFGVFASQTGTRQYGISDATPDFMYNQLVTYSGGWTYAPQMYWPGTDDGDGKSYVSFFAYAPYSNGDDSDPSGNPEGYCIPQFSSFRAVGNPYLIYRLHSDPARQVDLLCASPLVDCNKQDQNGEKLRFQFRHALATVGDGMAILLSSDLKAQLRSLVNGESVTSVSLRLTSASVTYHLTERGQLSLWFDGTPEWRTFLTEDVLTDRTVTMFSGGSQELYSYNGTTETATPFTLNGKGLFYIPAHSAGHEQKADFTVSYAIVTAGSSASTSPVTVTGTVTLSDYDAYAPGKKMDLNINL